MPTGRPRPTSSERQAIRGLGQSHKHEAGRLIRKSNPPSAVFPSSGFQPKTLSLLRLGIFSAERFEEIFPELLEWVLKTIVSYGMSRQNSLLPRIYALS